MKIAYIYIETRCDDVIWFHTGGNYCSAEGEKAPADDSIAASLIKYEHDSQWGTLMKGTDSWFNEVMMMM